MSKSLFVIVSLAAIISAASALAQDKPKGDKPGQPGRTSRAITWDEFKARCADPESFPDVQIEPKNIKVRCTETAVEFVQQSPGTIPLPGTRSIVTEVLSDKWFVSPTNREVEVPQKSGGCLRFKQVQRTFAYEVSLSCGAVLGLGKEPAAYCEDSLGKGGKDGKPKGGKGKELVEERDTGVVIDSCTGIDNGKGGK